MAHKTVISTINISISGEQGSGKTRTIDSLIQHLSHVGAMTSLSRDEDNHTASITIKHSVWMDDEIAKDKVGA